MEKVVVVFEGLNFHSRVLKEETMLKIQKKKLTVILIRKVLPKYEKIVYSFCTLSSPSKLITNRELHKSYLNTLYLKYLKFLRLKKMNKSRRKKST